MRTKFLMRAHKTMMSMRVQIKMRRKRRRRRTTTLMEMGVMKRRQ